MQIRSEEHANECEYIQGWEFALNSEEQLKLGSVCIKLMIKLLPNAYKFRCAEYNFFDIFELKGLNIVNASTYLNITF